MRSSLPVLVAAALVQLCLTAFVETFSIGPSTQFLLGNFIVDVALDVDHQLLKFFINSQVYSSLNASTTAPIITDVDPQTNRYTTFHVDIDFMGKTFILQNLRFCDILAVKNTSALETSVRYPGNSTVSLSSSSSSSVPTHTVVPLPPWPDVNGSSISRRNYFDARPLNTTSWEFGHIGSSNKTIENIFSNATGSLVQCPLYQNDSIVIYYQADISDHINRLGSYTVKFTVISNGQNSTVIGGARTYVTPVLQPRVFSSVLFFGVLGLLLATTATNLFIIVFSPNQESSNPFLIEASTICNEKLLNQLEASTYRVVGYFQFALFLAGLDLQYPGFVQPLMGQIRWCALLGINILQKRTWMSLLTSDNIYVTLNSGGLRSLALYTSDRAVNYSWPNFMTCLVVWIIITLFLYQCMIMFRLLTRKSTHKFVRVQLPVMGSQTTRRVEFNYTFSKNMWALVGHVFRQFLRTFGMPFLVLTFFMLYTAGNVNKRSTIYNDDHLRFFAYNSTLPYDFWTQKPAPQILQNEPLQPHKSNELVSTGSIVGGSFALAIWFSLIGFFIFRYLATFTDWKFHINPNLRRLYTSVKSVIVWSYFYNEYQPSKLVYAMVDIAFMILTLIVVGLLQTCGTAQVILLILIEFFRILLLIAVRPYYLTLKWHSLTWIMPGAKFVESILCIPYIRQLGVSEASRTYIAYIQMVIHLVVALVFVIRLFYCLGLTMVSIFNVHRKQGQHTLFLDQSKEGIDDFNDGFEYHPVDIKCLKRTSDSENTAALDSENTSAHLSPQSSDGDPHEIDYYRTHSEMILQRARSQNPSTPQTWENDTSTDFIDEPSIAPKKKNDYTTREADRIYQRFFSGGEIDPEIRELWMSRDWNPEMTSIAPVSLTAEVECRKFNRFLEIFKKKPQEKGFVVSRPRQIIVKPLQPVDSADMVSEQSSEDSPAA